MKIGLFFGSFNPIHIGHLIIANTMATSADLEQVWFVVSPQNPFKKNNSLLHEFDRYDLVQRAISDNSALKVTDFEFHMPKPSYTIDTLIRMQEKYPQHEFRLIIGEDNLAQFPNWKNHDKILEYTGLLVYPRPDSKKHIFGNHPAVKFVEAPLLDISATYIRNCLKTGKSIRYMVPEPVEQLIRIKKFYL
ncbi:nicotinate (nicotinamide) nucleotide adenylyltransferase [Dyadobacter sediminis]|uniref:Probable nicotinate-nucleotide adenylyltransferase n=1 Tax=Dyadobacter sediminis TaxID=1493691 RepID=A0A5R9K685_9BACT|nr:nicotinate (nicotinamide) nucleotide adenylyltransferase [Dyadobacter sediminis]TLU89163.1 nicotinate-nucleotide adenylyltransferase [Dyadobacter sediminis]GGC02305.1 putative nicotinate-nucleotide adenylyltransferase [Dyadobacter sediminis]